MSIASEIVRLQNAKSALKNAINPKLKESTTPIGSETLDQYVNFLNEIPLYAKASKVNSVQEMNALTDMDSGDLCVIYNNRGSSVLPNGYTQVEYIQSSGAQYIDTGYAPYKTKTEVKFQKLSNPRTFEYIMAGWNADNNRYYVGSYSYYNNNNFVAMDRSNNEINLGSYNSNAHIIIYNDENNKILFDNVSKGTISDLTTQTTNTLYLFANHASNDTQYYFTGRIYYVKITDKNTGTLVRNFIPCYRNSDNVIGMYDTVNGVFYTNQGTGAFTAGDVVPIGVNYAVYQYSGSTWIDITDEILTSITITPTTSSQTPTVPSGYEGFSSVTVNAVTSAIDANIIASNIRSGVTILGVTGNLVDYSSGMDDIKEILELDPSASEQDVVNAVENLKQTSEETLEAAEAIADLIIEGSEEQSGGEE